MARNRSDVGFSFEDGRRRHGTVIGTMVSLLIFMVLVFYGIRKLDDLKHYQETLTREFVVTDGMFGRDVKLSELNLGMVLILANLKNDGA